RQLREREEDYRSLFEHLPIGYARHRMVCDERGEPIDYLFLEANKAFEDATGLGRQEVLGKRVTEVIPDITTTDLIERYGRVALRGETLAFEKFVPSLGRTYDIRAFSPHRGEFVAIFSDVSGRVRQAELLRRRAEELERLMEVAPVAIWVSHDPGCRVITGNRTANQFYEAKPGENVSAGPEPGVVAAERRFFQDGRELAPGELPMQMAAARGIEVRDSELEVLLPSGRRIYMAGHALPLRDAGGELRGAVGAFLDITERHQQQEELARANRAKDEFLATLSHELRTPMNAILGWSHMLANGRLTPEQVPTAAAAIVRNAQAQHQLVNDVLDMSRIVRGKFQMRMEPVEIVSVIEKAVEAVQSAADAKDLRIRVVAPGDLPTIAADPDRLQQVFWNLVSNAIKFTPAGGGEITITVKQEGAEIEAAVTDRGEGISAEFLPHVFERFSQADSSSTRLHGGLGLGLAIVRHLVELHGGTVSAQSEGLGKGATFRIQVPTRAAVA
ncbi:MAG TPA: ATP-binding protein, partial [Vicinamibacterales bacterium]|nr:ATP-binding protein [Vicinamibacterales bacterium]